MTTVAPTSPPIEEPRSENVIDRHDPATWKNANVPVYVVQAMPNTSGQANAPAALEARCRVERDRPCPGVSDSAEKRGVTLKRNQALHAIYNHYRYPNWSICRFASAARVEYATDLIFEIDAHVGGLPTVRLTRELFEPIVCTAVAAGRRVVDYLQDQLAVDERYITAAVTRMGARVTVDWRAFGPRRLWEVLGAVRYIENEVFEAAEFANMARELERAVRPIAAPLDAKEADLFDWESEWAGKVTAKVEIDGRIYDRSDAPRRATTGENTFHGPFVRPLGAQHSKSSFRTMYYRTVPVPLDKFHPSNAAWLTEVSRHEEGPEPHRFELLKELWKWPEARHPKGDSLIEGGRGERRLPPAERLVGLLDELADDKAKLQELPEDTRRTVEKLRRPRSQLKGKQTVAEEDFARTVVEAVVDALPGKSRARQDGSFRLDCPYCRKDGLSAQMFPNGVFTCHRCKDEIGSPSLRRLANDHGLGHLLPKSFQASSKPVQLVRLHELPEPHPCRSWESLGAEVVAPVVVTLDEARAALGAYLDRELRDGAWDLMIIGGPTGLGKTTTTLRKASELNLVVRGLFARKESRDAMLDAYPAARLIDGRSGENCENYQNHQSAMNLGLAGWRVCSSQGCPHRSGCPYVEQFNDLEGESVALLHSHLPELFRTKFDNDANVTIVDENPWAMCIDNTDIGKHDLGALRVWHRPLPPRDDDDPHHFDFALDGPNEPACVNTAVGRVVNRLRSLLSGDAVFRLDDEGHEKVLKGLVTDYAIARLLLGDDELREAVWDLTDADVDEHEVEALEVALRGLGLAPAEQGVHEETELDDGDSEVRPSPLDLTEQDIAAVVPGYNTPSVTGEPARPPKQILRQLVEALRGLYSQYAAESHETNPLHARRQKESWALRLTEKKKLHHGRTVILSSTARPEQVRLAFGEGLRIKVFAPEVRQREKRIAIADRMYSQRQVPGDEKLTARLFETIKKLIESENERTGLPVALIGYSELINAINEHVLGELDPKLKMPFQVPREQKFEALKELTLPHGYISGYAYGVAGSNAFSVVDAEGNLRFVRSLIIPSNVIPPLTEVESTLRGVYAGDLTPEDTDLGPTLYPTVIDWTQVVRTVPMEEAPPNAGSVHAAMNVPGFAGARANELLHSVYESEIIQVAGRMRGSIRDPVDPSIQPRLYIFSNIGIDGFPFDEITSLEKLRGQLGLSVQEPGTRGRRPSIDLDDPEAVRKLWRGKGPAATIRRLVEHLGGRHCVTTEGRRGMVESIKGLVVGHAIQKWTAGHEKLVVAALKDLTKLNPEDPSDVRKLWMDQGPERTIPALTRALLARSPSGWGRGHVARRVREMVEKIGKDWSPDFEELLISAFKEIDRPPGSSEIP